MQTAAAIIGGLVIVAVLFRFVWGLWKLPRNKHPNEGYGNGPTA